MNLMKSYLDYLSHVLHTGRKKYNERTGKFTLSEFGGQLTFDVRERFPLLQERKMHLRPIADEMCWFLRGDTNISTLNSKIWDLWAVGADDLQTLVDSGRAFLPPGTPVAELDNVIIRSDRLASVRSVSVGDLGPVYGKMWRDWPNGQSLSRIDQIQNVLDTLKANPSSRRIIVSGWNPAVLPDETLSPQENVINGKQALPPCHTLFQFICEEMSQDERRSWAKSNFNVTFADRIVDEALEELEVPKHYLSLKLYARSQDLPVGTVFNIAEYTLLLYMVAEQVGMVPYRYIHTMGDAHIYEDQIDGVKELLSRDISPSSPVLRINPGVKSLFDYTAKSFTLSGYDPLPGIVFPIAK